jgi:putative heme transporter
MTVLPIQAARPDRRVLAGIVSVVIVAGVFGFALPQIASYGAAWHDLTDISITWLPAVAAAAAGSMVTSWLAIVAVLPQVRLPAAAAVNLSSSAVANTVPAGGAVSLGVSWRMLAGWGVTTPQFVRYTLVSGLWNVFTRLGLPAAALTAVAVSGGPSGIPPMAAYCGAAVLLVTVAAFRALLRSPRAAAVTARAVRTTAAAAARLARRPPPAGLADGVLRFRRDTAALLAERGARITTATVAAQLTPWLVLLACLRASGLSQAQVSWQLSLAAFALVRLLTVLPITPGGLGVVELGLAGPLAAGLGAAGAARVAAAVLLFRAVTYLPSLPLGALAFVWWRRTRPDSDSCPRSQLVPEKAA